MCKLRIVIDMRFLANQGTSVHYCTHFDLHRSERYAARLFRSKEVGPLERLSRHNFESRRLLLVFFRGNSVESELRKVQRAQRGSEECSRAFRDNISRDKNPNCCNRVRSCSWKNSDRRKKLTMAVVLWKPIEVLAALERSLPQMQV